jgi:hypothetical protein
MYKTTKWNVRFQVLTAASMMFRIVFWDVLLCKLIVDRRFRVAYCLHHQGWLIIIPDDGGSTHLWNVGRQLFYTAVHPRRQFWTSYKMECFLWSRLDFLKALFSPHHVGRYCTLVLTEFTVASYVILALICTQFTQVQYYFRNNDPGLSRLITP